MKAELTKRETIYTGTFTSKDKYIEDFTITKTDEPAYGKKGALTIKIGENRWRTPEEAIAYLEEIKKTIKDTFL